MLTSFDPLVPRLPDPQAAGPNDELSQPEVPVDSDSADQDLDEGVLRFANRWYF